MPHRTGLLLQTRVRFGLYELAKQNIMTDNILNESDREEIARLVKDGFTSGLLDRDGFRISWVLTADIIKYQ